ncbi:MAG: DNA repair protein RecO [Verrucomicrobiota bacterium]
MDSPALVLHRYPYSETSWIVHWWTEAEGRVKTVAKGARRPKSALAGRLDLFFTARISWVPSRKSDLHVLREADLENPRLHIRERYWNTMAAAYFTAWLDRVEGMEMGEAAELYSLLTRALDFLNDQPVTLKAVLHFERKLAETLGILQPGRPPEESLRELFGLIPSQRLSIVAALTSSG